MASAAGGSLAGELTFSTWKGRPYLKKHRTPKQPRTPGQLARRAMMAFLSQAWKTISPQDRATWSELARASEISAFNAYQRENLNRWHRRRPPSKAYPAAEAAGLTAVTMLTATGGVRHVDLDANLFAILGDNWTALLFHSPLAIPDPDVDKLVHVWRAETVDHYYWTHSPLAAGTHYYRLVTAAADGDVDWSTFSTASAVVT